MRVGKHDIYVSEHAKARARQRYPELRLLPNEQLYSTIASEVANALDDGRCAVRQPRFTVSRPESSRGKNRNGGRFVWSRNENHVYSIRRANGQVVVVTAYTTYGRH